MRERNKNLEQTRCGGSKGNQERARNESENVHARMIIKREQELTKGERSV